MSCGILLFFVLGASPTSIRATRVKIHSEINQVWIVAPGEIPVSKVGSEDFRQHKVNGMGVCGFFSITRSDRRQDWEFQYEC